MTIPLTALQQQFQEAIADLWWVSETEAPFEITILPQAFQQGFSIHALTALIELDSGRPIQEISVDQFFAPAIQEQNWHGELEKAEIRQFQTLKTLISQQLSDVRVYQIGEIQLDIIIVGKTDTNDWIALATQAVET